MAGLFVVIRPALPKTLMDWVHISIVGVLIQALYFGMCFLAFRAGVAAGTVALLMSLQPILVGLIAPSWTGESIGWKRWAGLILGLIGAAIVIAARTNIEPPTLFGFGCMALALFGITTGTLWEKRFGLAHHPIVQNLAGYAAALVFILPFMIALEPMTVEWTWQLSAALSYLVIGNSLIAVGLLLAMIRAGDVSSVSALFFLVPPLAALLAWLMLGEIMPPVAWIGMALAAIGVFVATRSSSGGKSHFTKR